MFSLGSILEFDSPNVSVAKVSTARPISNNRRVSSSRSSSPLQERSLSQHGRKKGRSKQRLSSHSQEIVADRRSSRPSAPPNVLRTSKTNPKMVLTTRSKEKQREHLKRKRASKLDELAKKGLTLDENSRVVRMDNGEELEEEAQEHNNNVGSGSDDSSDFGDSSDSDSGHDTVRVATSKSKTTSFKSNAAAAKSKPPQMKPKPSSKQSKAVTSMRKQLAVVRSKSKGKKSDVDDNDETLVLIKDCVRKHLWALCKIVNSKQTQEKAAMMCLRFLDLEEFNGDGEKYEALRAEWIESYSHIVTSELNNLRSYVQNRVKHACFHWMEEHNGIMPSEALLKKVIDRDIDLDKEEEVEAMKWWWDDTLVYAAGNLDDWHPDKRHYLPISTAAPPELPGKFYIMPSTEGIAMAFIENNRSKWKALFDAKKQFPNAKKLIVTAKVRVDASGKETEEFTENHKGKKGHILCNGQKYMTKWTDSAGGQQEFNGWSKEGRDYYVAHFRANEAARKKPTTPALEKAILDLIRADYGKTANTAQEERDAKKRKSKKAKAAPVEDDDDGMEF